MGNLLSTVKTSRASVHSKTRRNGSISSKLATVLLARRAVHDAQEHPITFERVVLRLERLHPVLRYLRKTFFDSADANGRMSLSLVPQVMQTLHKALTEDEVFDLFDFIDVTHAHSVGVKEFLIALCVGHLLGIIPALEELSVSQIFVQLQENPLSEQLHNRHADIKEVLELIVSTFILFDPQGNGCINQSQVLLMIRERGKRDGLDLMFSEERWSEVSSHPLTAMSLVSVD